MNYCGYIDRDGCFIDCSKEEGIFKHTAWCESQDVDEDDLMDMRGWVKLTCALPNKYLYAYCKALSDEQADWLANNGFEIDENDLWEGREDWHRIS